MRTCSLLAVLAVVGTGCPAPDPPPRGGQPMNEYFPFDGERTWSYESTDTALPHRLVATMVGDPVEHELGRIYEVETVHSCSGATSCVDGTVESVIRWSSDSVAGVHVHGYDDVVLDPPLQVADEEGWVGLETLTTTGGLSWTSTVEAFEACPVRMNVNWEECVRIRITADGDGGPMVGTWWANAGINVVAFEPEGATGRWELSDHVCDGDCNGFW